MPNNTSAAFIEALRGKLVEVLVGIPDYADVAVVIVPDGATVLNEAVSLIRPPRSGPIANPAGKAEGSQEWAATGRRRRTDDFTIESSLWVKTAGKTDESSTTFREAMDRASGLLDQVIIILRDEIVAGGILDVGDQIITAVVSRYEYRPATTPEGWAVICDFDITAKTRVS